MFKISKFSKNAMTLAELLLVFVIMGVVASMCIISAKPMDKSLKYSYHRVYDSLGTAFYNAISTVEFPETSEDFCKALLLYINSTAGGDANCSASAININQSSTALDAALNSSEPHFVASNGIKFWIGSTGHEDVDEGVVLGYTTQHFSCPDIDGGPTVEGDVRYFIVIADLNGSSKPNTTNWSLTNAADIVAYLVTETAEVIPLGAPEVDPRYLLARVVFSSYSNGVENEDLKTSNLMSYYEAKRSAWAVATPANNDNGIHPKIDEQMTLNFYAGGVEGNSGYITSTSPFYFHWTDKGANGRYGDLLSDGDNGIADKKFINMPQTPNCATKKADGNYGMSFDACYIKISDFY